MGLRILTGIGVLITFLCAQEACAADPTVKVAGAQGKTATKQAKITFGLENADGKVLAATDWLNTLTIDGTNVAVDSVALTGGNTAMGIITWPSGGPAPGDHTVKITVNLKGGGTATMAVTTITFVE
jgi:hypothetical protein